MVLKITKHIPVYVTDVNLEIVEFITTHELLELDFVKLHSQQIDFYRYSINKSPGNFRIPLLAEYEGGKKWIVIGFLEGDISKIDLPAWENHT